MKRIIILITITLIGSVSCPAQIFGPNHHIQCYFTRPVDNSYARTEKAIALIRTAGDTVIAYINRAKYTLDIAMYDFVEDSLWFEHGNIPNIAAAINNAYARGVKIRWICNQFDTVYSPNTGLDSINKSIYVLPSPSGGSYGIMHNKFMVIDGRSSNPNDPIVWTGCMNWEPGQIDKDANNLVIIQDSALAHCYLMEFNQMWGDTVEGGKYNLTNSKFGPFKKNITPHNFIIDGHLVESYFSPSDGVNNHILSTIEAAKKEIDFGVFEFSFAADATEINTMKGKGIYIAGILDQYSLSYSTYGTMSSILGNMLQVYFGNDSLFHNKYVIVDPCDMQADPMVLTGSHNWTNAANNMNDENTLIIHDSTTANLFYQAFIKTFTTLAQFSLVQQCVPLAVNELADDRGMDTYPNPSTNYLKVTLNIPGNNEIYAVYDITGQMVLRGKFDTSYMNTIYIGSLAQGMYMLRVFRNNTTEFTKKFIKQ